MQQVPKNKLYFLRALVQVLSQYDFPNRIKTYNK
jgi:hypothetical protein